MATLDTNSATWMVVRHYCRTRMRELEREVISQPVMAPGQVETEEEMVDRPDLTEESFEA